MFQFGIAEKRTSEKVRRKTNKPTRLFGNPPKQATKARLAKNNLTSKGRLFRWRGHFYGKSWKIYDHRRPHRKKHLPMCFSVHFANPFDPVNLHFYTFARIGLESVPAKGRTWELGRGLDLAISLSWPGLDIGRWYCHVAHCKKKSWFNRKMFWKKWETANYLM